ncbi:MAG: xylose isomerase, partial [Cryomorphaceae bacterium BACL29 MAG-121220-bin8]
MERRNFILNSSLVLAGVLSFNSAFSNQIKIKKHKFNLNYAPHIGMFKYHAGSDPIDQLIFMLDQGFTAFEDNNMKNRDVEIQKKIGAFMLKNNMKMGVFVGHTIYWKQPNLAGGSKEKRLEFLSEIKSSIEVAKRVNAKWMTVVPGHVDLRLNMGYQTSNVIESLKQASDLLEPHGLKMVLEPLNFRDHPGLFLTKSPQAYEICKAVNSPSCKIL